ncbi:hypothetical protein MCOR02_004240 [Pyricularia oryzae]|nr:hypothetical protein MCOR02_004240 [Pyricularia oryzae]
MERSNSRGPGQQKGNRQPTTAVSGVTSDPWLNWNQLGRPHLPWSIRRQTTPPGRPSRRRPARQGCRVHQAHSHGLELQELQGCPEACQEFPGTVYSTAGVHPCSSAIFGATHPHHHEAEDDEHTAACDPDPEKPVPADDEGTPDLQKTEQIVADLDALVRSAGPGLVAFGEFGLDYDRLHYCPKKLQLHSFSHQLDLVVALQKEKLEFPLFLHSRAAHADFVSLLKEKFGNNLSGLARGGVVHSFTGTAEEARELMDLGLYIGINGCSFKTAENCDVVREIRLDRIMIETDGPWCEVRPSHEGWKYLVEDAKRKAADEEQVAAAAAAATVDGNSQPPRRMHLRSQQTATSRQRDKRSRSNSSNLAKRDRRRHPRYLNVSSQSRKRNGRRAAW